MSIKNHNYSSTLYGISVIELLLSISLTVILFGGMIVLMSFLGQHINDQHITYNGIDYFKAPSHKALNKALELNLEFMEQCRMANGAIIFGGIGINPEKKDFYSFPLRLETSIDTIKDIINSNRDLLSNSFKLYDWIAKNKQSLLEETTENEGFTVLLLNNDYQLQCICQVRQYNHKENVLLTVRLETLKYKKENLTYHFYVPKGVTSSNQYSEIIRKWYFFNENKNSPIEGPVYITLPDPYLRHSFSNKSTRALSRFNYYLDAKK